MILNKILLCFMILMVDLSCMMTPRPQPSLNLKPMCCLGLDEHICEMSNINNNIIPKKFYPMITHFPLIDNKNILHQYKDNFDRFIFPKHNKKLTQYCSIHRNWEDIKAIWSKNNQVDFKWQYHVSRHKKRF